MKREGRPQGLGDGLGLPVKAAPPVDLAAVFSVAAPSGPDGLAAGLGPGATKDRVGKLIRAGLAADMGRLEDDLDPEENLDPLADFNSLVACAPSPAYVDWIHEVVARDGQDWHIGIDLADLGFIRDYRHMAGILDGHRRAGTVVVDVGCSTALQHVFFAKFKGYVGIDFQAEQFKVFTDNAKLVSGDFGDLVESGRFVITEDMVGIANMSLLYSGDPERNERSARALRMFERFRRKIIL
jgi:SAM-dependent methyltransferase